MSRYAVWIVTPKDDEHWQGLRDVADGIVYSLRMLGHDCELALDADVPETDRTLIVFNAHRLSNGVLPPGTIIYNAEQVRHGDDVWYLYLDLLSKHTVWDYSEVNVERLRDFGVERVIHCPVGYWTGLSNIKPSLVEDVDVLFIGSLNDRRLSLLNAVAGRKLKTHVVFGSYGAERDAWIARSKIVLNIHFYEQPIFEIFRVSRLLANRKCVVSEGGGCDPALEAFAARATALVLYEQIADTCSVLIRDDKRRREVAEEGFRAFAMADQVGAVKYALEMTT